MKAHFEPVPPPREAPEQPEAKRLGLLRGLRTETTTSGPYRCASCSRWMRKGDTEVQVPDAVNAGDSADVITEACRRNAYNGSFSAWCLPCALKLGRPTMLGALRRFFSSL
jgi:hypothetical protein